jgi:4-hydroxy-tetrahydrodipicolinate reductase
MSDTKRLKICVVGATGRMGGTILKDAPLEAFEITGAVAAAGEPGVGRTLRELGTTGVDVTVRAPDSLLEAIRQSDVCLSFTAAAAEIANLPVVISAGRPFVLGTTGFTDEQRRWVVESLKGAKIPTVMTSNFSIGANVLFAVASDLERLPKNFDISITEAHHSGKADAPSGTATTIAEIVSRARGYSRTVHGRSGMSKRSPDELEVLSLRGGGVPGIHEIYAFGPNEMLKFEHLAFSRSVFAQGALLAARWVSEGRAPGVYDMLDVLGLRGR